MKLHETVYLADGAKVVADVTIGAGSSVWYNAVVRGDECPVVIGTGTNIQDCCVVHGDIGATMTVGNDVTVGHGAILHSCVVEDGALIGMGAIVLHRAVIGKNAMVAAGALVPPGMVVPEGMLAVGSPARLVKPLTEQAVRGNQENTALYGQMARHIQDGLIHFEKET